MSLIAAALCVLPAFASESFPVSVEIPVENLSESGTFAVFEDSRIADEIYLAGGEKGVLRLSLMSLDEFDFTVRRTGTDGPGRDAEGQEYAVHVMTYVRDGKADWALYAKQAGADGKTGRIVFLPAEDPPASDPPQTGDESAALYVCLAAAAAALPFLLWAAGRRKAE